MGGTGNRGAARSGRGPADQHADPQFVADSSNRTTALGHKCRPSDTARAQIERAQSCRKVQVALSDGEIERQCLSSRGDVARPAEKIDITCLDPAIGSVKRN